MLLCLLYGLQLGQVPWQTHDALFELLQLPQNRHLERPDDDITVCKPLEGWQSKLPPVGGWTIIDLGCGSGLVRSEEHTSELQSLMRISYDVFCLKKKQTNTEQ